MVTEVGAAGEPKAAMAALRGHSGNRARGRQVYIMNTVPSEEAT
jgi:hypothetical protein